MDIHRTRAFAPRIGVHRNTVKTWNLNGKLPAGTGTTRTGMWIAYLA